ncbi:protein of unknown function [Taphrina deformans PYCC 5710]|uniref:Zn(2)-C6 fungal-type domain-containing protein n=1 Tax=Taphrina deformans (strain PYCC 5710 / ATCC 11124 / CBS 356.35 / IMI 108563 / JCM 9778 / NBRC 8474) TaxID=1097556 RepID=R4XG57_TAPDE|nr:protein of unknown function [Taphrina deformans PYCC 5710]|eukprot:CCG84720.2 protein of unknown function [Taphrina deformans PYCC 5710]
MDTASHERSYEGTQTRPISSGTSNLTHGGPGFDNLTPDKHRETRRRTKTGCLTCRKRRIKCDEGKPDCLRCLKSKRPCEGYNSKTVFRNENQQHYQQSIRPSPAGNSSTQKSSYTTPSNVQFSIPQYQSMAQPGFSSYSHQVPSMSLLSGAFESPHESGQLLSSNKMPLTFNSRNSSASNASGVSANSEQRRISVLSLISSDTKDDYPSAERPARSNNSHIVLPQISPRLPPVSEARDNL